MITFDEEKHEYKDGGKTIPSVTQIISEITGTQWNAAPWYLERGRAIHACAAFIAEGKQFKFDERLSGYVEALKKFFNETEATEIKSEMLVFSSLYRFAGMLDLKCKIGDRKYIIDFKHSIDKIRIALQLGGYSQACKDHGGEEINFGIGVQIKENGDYRFTDSINLRIPRNEFLALRTAYRIKEKCKTLSLQKEGKDD
jgi:hypothetical protein